MRAGGYILAFEPKTVKTPFWTTFEGIFWAGRYILAAGRYILGGKVYSGRDGIYLDREGSFCEFGCDKGFTAAERVFLLHLKKNTLSNIIIFIANFAFSVTPPSSQGRLSHKHQCRV